MFVVTNVRVNSLVFVYLPALFCDVQFYLFLPPCQHFYLMFSWVYACNIQNNGVI